MCPGPRWVGRALKNCMSQSGVQEVVRSFIVEEGDRVADKDWGAGLLIRIGVRGESQGRGSLLGCRVWSCTESDMTEVT